MDNDDYHYRKRFYGIAIIASLPAWVILLWGSINAESGSASAAVTNFTGALQRLPTQLWFYVSIATLAAASLAWRWWQYINLEKEFHDAEENGDGKRGLISRDWWVVQNIRKRALSLRARADLLLFAVFGLLFGGIYLILFILPGLEALDTFVAQQVRFEERFGEELESMIEGRQWVKVENDRIRQAFQKGNGADLSTRDEISLWVASEDMTEWESTAVMTVSHEDAAMQGLINAKSKSSLVVSRKGAMFVATQGVENWKQIPDIGFEDEERVTRIVMSADGSTGVMVGNEGTVFAATEGLENWKQISEIGFDDGERLSRLAISADGSAGVMVGTEGTVFVTTEGMTKWAVTETAFEGGWTSEIALSADGRFGVMFDNQRRVFVTTEGVRNWEPIDVGFKEWVMVTEIAISADGSAGVLVGNSGTLFVTTEGVKNWERIDIGFEDEELATEIALSADGKSGVLVGNNGTLFVTTEGVKNWQRIEVGIGDGERINKIALSADGKSGVLVGNDGTLFVTTEGVHNWETSHLELKDGEQVYDVDVSAEANISVLGGFRRVAYMTTDNGSSWQSTNFGVRRSLAGSALSSSGRVGVIKNHAGTTYMTTDYGKSWKTVTLPFNTGEEITAIAFSPDGNRGVIAGHMANIFLTIDGGVTWKPTILALDRAHRAGVGAESETGEKVEALIWLEDENSGSAPNDFENTASSEELGRSPLVGPRSLVRGFFVVVTTQGKHHVLRAYPELASWREQTPRTIKLIMEVDEHLRSSFLSQRISVFLLEEANAAAADTTTTAENEEDKQTSRTEGRSFDDYFDNLTVMRLATSTILFFLVQLLVRLYQYSLRLAAFWESRSDAILLDYSFAEKRSERFDELVGALAPDAYDFRAPPRSPLDWLRSRRSL